MLQSNMPNECSCKANESAYGSSENDFEKRNFCSTRSSARESLNRGFQMGA